MAWTTTTTRSTGFLVTAAVWNAEHVDNLTHLALVTQATPVTADVVCDVTTSGTSQLIIALPAVTYTATPHIMFIDGGGVERTQVAAGSPSFFVGLYDGAAGSPLDRLETYKAPGTSPNTFPMAIRHTWTPTAASHTYQIRGYTNTADSWTILAGAGGADVVRPLTVQVFKVPV